MAKKKKRSPPPAYKRHQKFASLFIRRIPATLKAFYKAACAKRGKSMQSVLLEHMRQVVKTDSDIDRLPAKE